jgi:hypothetical protein
MPDCWLEVSLHPEGPATGQLDQGIPWFSSILEEVLTWYPEFHASHAALPLVTSKFRPNVNSNFTIMQPFWRYIK